MPAQRVFGFFLHVPWWIDGALNTPIALYPLAYSALLMGQPPPIRRMSAATARTPPPFEIPPPLKSPPFEIPPPPGTRLQIHSGGSTLLPNPWAPWRHQRAR